MLPIRLLFASGLPFVLMSSQSYWQRYLFRFSEPARKDLMKSCNTGFFSGTKDFRSPFLPIRFGIATGLSHHLLVKHSLFSL